MFDRSREWHESVICSDLQRIITRQFSKSPSSFSKYIDNRGYVSSFDKDVRVENSHTISRFSTLINSHATLVLV